MYKYSTTPNTQIASLNNRTSSTSINFVWTASVPSIAILVWFQIAAHGTGNFRGLE